MSLEHSPRPEDESRNSNGISQHERLTYTIIEAGQLLGIGRNQAYEAAHRGDIPTIKIGKRLLVPRAALKKLLNSEAA